MGLIPGEQLYWELQEKIKDMISRYKIKAAMYNQFDPNGQEIKWCQTIVKDLEYLLE